MSEDLPVDHLVHLVAWESSVTSFNVQFHIANQLSLVTNWYDALQCAVYQSINWYDRLKKPTITETIRLHRLHWFGHVQRMEGNRNVLYWIYLLPSTQQTIGYNGFTTTCFDSHESSSGYVQNLLALAVLLLTFLEVVGRYEVVAVLTLIWTKFWNIYQELLPGTVYSSIA
jgi:hypothetical protein